MRSLLASSLAAMLLAASTAAAEKRIFIIANDADGYGVDRCLASGASCGAAAAAAYCRAQDYAEAASYHRVERADITGAVPVADRVCRGEACMDFVAIECQR